MHSNGVQAAGVLSTEERRTFLERKATIFHDSGGQAEVRTILDLCLDAAAALLIRSLGCW